MKKNAIMKIGMVMAYMVMIILNMLANYLPINNVTTGEVSRMYPTLITPANYVFIIWGLIYFLLAAYILLHFYVFQAKEENDALIQKVSLYFILSCIANGLWIVAWHHYSFIAALLLLGIILFSLWNMLKISQETTHFMRVTIGVYFGWTTVAFIANAAIVLLAIGFDDFLFGHDIWTMLVLTIATVIATLTSWRFMNVSYLLAFLWGYVGILVQHMSSQGLNRQYPLIIATVSILIIWTTMIGLIVMYKRYKSVFLKS